LCAFAAFSDPGRAFVPSHEDDLKRGVAVPDGFRLRLLAAVGASFRSLVACLAASRHVGPVPALLNNEDPYPA